MKEEWLEKAHKIGLTMNIDKCHFKTDEVICLRHKLSKNAIHPDSQKPMQF